MSTKELKKAPAEHSSETETEIDDNDNAIEDTVERNKFQLHINDAHEISHEMGGPGQVNHSNRMVRLAALEVEKKQKEIETSKKLALKRDEIFKQHQLVAFLESQHALPKSFDIGHSIVTKQICISFLKNIPNAHFIFSEFARRNNIPNQVKYTSASRDIILSFMMEFAATSGHN